MRDCEKKPDADMIDDEKDLITFYEPQRHKSVSFGNSLSLVNSEARANPFTAIHR